MFVQGKFILESYIPDKIVPGMWFLALQHKDVVLYEPGVFIDHPEKYEVFVQLNGYPVRPHIYIEGDPNVPESSYLLVPHDKIGWFDEGGHTDEMHDITLKEINNILEDSGYCQVEIEEEVVHYDDDESMDGYDVVPFEDENGHFVPTLLEGLCTIRYHLHVDDFDEDEEDDIEDDDDDEDCDEYDNMCGNCSGTGMGQWDGSSCMTCGGSGEIRTSNRDWDDYDYYPENH